MRAWPSTSSGLVGSSIHQGSNAASRAIDSIASSTPQTWFASIMSLPSGPSASRISRRPALVRREVLTDLHLHVPEARRRRPGGRGPRPSRRRSRASRPRWCRRDTRRRAAPARAARARVPRAAAGRAPPRAGGRPRCSGSRCCRRSPSGERFASSCQSGWPARLARRSQMALTTAAVARWTTPFSGPSQRSWLSEARLRQNARMSPVMPSSVRPTTNGSSARIAATHDLGAAAVREGQAVPFEPVVLIRAEDHVGRRVVGVDVHGVRAVQPARGGEADVACLRATRCARSRARPPVARSGKVEMRLTVGVTKIGSVPRNSAVSVDIGATIGRLIRSFNCDV